MFVAGFHALAFGVAATFALLSTEAAQAQEAWMVATQRVEDFDRWKEVFDQALPIRGSAGGMAS